MVKIPIKILAFEQAVGKRLVLAGAAIFTAAIVTSTGVAAAKPLHENNDPKTGPANVQLCKDHYKDFGFKNQGQCVSFFNKHHGGNGYGGNHGHHGHGHHHHHHHHHHFHFDFGGWWHDFWSH